jgi:hypothetical protein
MPLITSTRSHLREAFTITLGLALLAGCAGPVASGTRPEEFIEIQNPGLTMSPNAPETIWVPRSSLEKGVPRGSELAKQGYQAVKGALEPAAKTAPDAAPRTDLVDTHGNPVSLVPHFGQVIELEGERVYFNLGREDGVLPGRVVQVYRGGTVVKGLGLAPGEPVATIEVQGLAGSRGGYGVVKKGGPVRKNDLVGCD